MYPDAQLLHDVCRERGYTVATAESCTGGLIGGAITDVPGSSHYFLGGLVVYSNLAKENLLEVPEDLLVAHGAVSEPVAQAMAQGARRRFGATWAVSATGIAGPAADGSHKPVGLVYIGVAGPDDTVLALKNNFPGDREAVRTQTVKRALQLLLERMGEADA